MKKYFVFALLCIAFSLVFQKSIFASSTKKTYIPKQTNKSKVIKNNDSCIGIGGISGAWGNYHLCCAGLVEDTTGICLPRKVGDPTPKKQPTPTPDSFFTKARKTIYAANTEACSDIVKTSGWEILPNLQERKVLLATTSKSEPYYGYLKRNDFEIMYSTMSNDYSEAIYEIVEPKEVMTVGISIPFIGDNLYAQLRFYRCAKDGKPVLFVKVN